MRRHATLSEALRNALMEHYEEPGSQLVHFPLEDTIASFLIVASEITLALPPGPRRDAFRFMVDMITAAERSGEQRITIGHALANLRGVPLN